MIALIQRVLEARVDVDQHTIAKIDQGLLAFIAIEPSDSITTVELMLDKLLNYRIFEDDDSKMNLSVKAISGGLLLVPQFTLAADTSRGLRPSFSGSAPPQLAESLFGSLCELAQTRHTQVQQGKFGADMQVSLTNGGPATFWLQIP